MLTTSCLSIFANPFPFLPIQRFHGVSWLAMQETHALLFWSWKKMLSCEAKLEDLCFDMNCLIRASPHVVHFEETCRKSK